MIRKNIEFKQYLNQPGRASKIQSRRLGNTHFLSSAYRSDAPGDEDGDDAEKLMSRITAKIGEATKSLTDENNAFKTKQTELIDAMKQQGIEIAELKKNNPGAPVDMSIKGQVGRWMEEHKDILKKVKDGEKGVSLPTLTLKAPHTMLLSTDAQAPVPYYIANGAEVIDLVRIQPSFWRNLRKGRTSLPAYPWVNKTNKEGAAAFIGEGVLKPLASFQLEPEISVPKKVAERMKASTELLFDVEGMATLIEQELRFEVEVAANTAVLSGTASSTSPAGVTTIATPYNLTTVQTTNPTVADVIRAMAAQIRSLGYTQPLTAYLNPIDIANMDMEKADTAGVYMFRDQYGRLLADIRVQEDNNIPVGNVLVGAMDNYKVLMYQDFFIAWGWENDDFSKNLVTVIGEMRFHQFVSQNHLTGFVYDTIADVKAAIEIPNP